MTVAGTNGHGDDSISADRDADKEIDEQVDEKGVRTDGSQRLARRKAPHHGHVDRDEQLLQDAAHRERHGHLQHLA